MEKILNANWWIILVAFFVALLLTYFGIGKTKEGIEDNKPLGWEIASFKNDLRPRDLGLKLLFSGLGLILGSIAVALIKLNGTN